MTHTNDLGQPVGFPLPGWKPCAPPPRTQMQGRTCRLEPLDAGKHAADLHAANITDTLATFLILAGLAVPSLVAGEWLIAVKLLFVLIFLWFTSPIASYSIGHAAFFAAQKPKLDHDLTDGEGGTA